MIYNIKKQNYTILILLLLLGIQCQNRKLRFSDPNYILIRIQHQNHIRESLLYYPENYETINFNLNPEVITFPLIISLHGGGGNKQSNLFLSKGRLLELKEKYGFFLLLPEAYKQHWNDGRNISSKSHQLQIDDVNYIQTLIQYLLQHYPIDKERIYIFGISNGGMMSFRFACEAGSWIRGFASISATMPANLIHQCNPVYPISFLLIHGTSDPFIPYQGGKIKIFFQDRGNVISAKKTIEFWLHKNQCNPHFQKEILSRNQDTITEIYRYSCKHQSKVWFYKVINGGHTWPGGWQYLPEWYIGKTSRNFFAEEVIIRFFLNH